MDDALFLEICRDNYNAVLLMLRQAIDDCPEQLWPERADEPPFWQQAYHTLWWLDFYLSDAPRTFQPPAFAEERAQDLETTPSSVPTREQMLAYIEQVSKKCDQVLTAAASLPLDGVNTFHWTGRTYAHRLVYNMRHTQDHVSALRSMLTRRRGKSPGWKI